MKLKDFLEHLKTYWRGGRAGRKLMKKAFAVILSAIILLTLAACDRTADDNISQNEPKASSSTPRIKTIPVSASVTDDLFDKPKQIENGESGMTNISITVGNSVFSAKLYNSDAAQALLEQFPMTVSMNELNKNEKYYYLPDKLPAASERVGSIRTGDLMLYGSDCLVLFYKDFSTSYSYTRLGYIEDPSSLKTALGNGSVQVTFAVGD